MSVRRPLGDLYEMAPHLIIIRSAIFRASNIRSHGYRSLTTPKLSKVGQESGLSIWNQL
jgi:hypothetical protein